jgi:membrane associated rhomboid family serine protease
VIFDPRGAARESFELRGGSRAIVLDEEGVHHPSSPQGRGRAYTPYRAITHLAASPRTLWIGARQSVYVLARRSFADPRGPEHVVGALLARIGQLPDGTAQLARMAEVDEAARALPRVRATWVLVAACLAAYLAQLSLGQVVFEVSYFSPALVLDGDLWRVLTANLVHAFPRFPLHLGLNLIGLMALGMLVERSLGAARATCVMGASALGAMAASGFADYAAVVGVSGVVFGLAGGVLWLELRRAEQLPAWLRVPRRAFFVLLLLNAAIMAAIPMIAGAAHLGGFAAGYAATAGVAGREIRRIAQPVWIKAASALTAAAVLLAMGTAAAELAGGQSFMARHAQRLAYLPGISPFELNDRAWYIAISSDSTPEELEAALLLAERAVFETERAVPGVLDTLAEVLFLLGHRDKAVATIDEAIERDPEESYYREQRRRFTGERPVDDRPEGPFPAPPPRREPAPPAGAPGLTV